MKDKILLVLLFIVILAVFSSIFVIYQKSANLQNKNYLKVELPNNEILSLKILSTEDAMKKGLSNTEFLPANEGALFVFENSGYPGIWMKDMKYPIDIAWLSKDKQVVHIEARVSPLTFPKVFLPSQSSLYVAEVNAGFFENKNIKIGDKLEF